MSKLWFSSDLHLFHTNMWKLFKLSDGSPARPFSSDAEMNSTMLERHNAVVSTVDHWWNLGDVTMLRSAGDKWKFVQLLKQFNGHKRLILGNHDQYDMQTYRDAGFEKIKGSHRIGNLIFSHWPLHPESICKDCVNVHGHIHQSPTPAGPYINISVEAINYTPVSLEWLQDKASDLIKETK